MHLVGFIIRIYHDAQSPERQTRLKMFTYGQEQRLSAKRYVVMRLLVATGCFCLLR